MVDLTVAIQVGVVLAAILFMHRMAQVVQVEQGVGFLQGDVSDAQMPALDFAFQTLPYGVEMFRLRGSLFFGAARSLRDALEAMPKPPRVFILRMRNVPMIDSSRSSEHTSELPSLIRISYDDVL